ncbi:prostate stem cell antigen-like [Lepisosteus oculatus]|uniref:Prostate stem cell antigen-like n=1 Tax=Lepisosteus oculatus TaxID=7918 RepID=W5MM03_LEPOC|nr:PREDICTED: prostate stem cell antigen-like [Lepisosteus oculatus]
MKTGLAFLLLVSMSTLSVEALQCYVCSSTMSNTQCNQSPQNCTTGDTCMTTVTNVLGLHYITKECSTAGTCASAAATNVNLVIGGKQVTCCSTNLCNVSGFELTRLNLLLLGLPSVLLMLVTTGAA